MKEFQKLKSSDIPHIDLYMDQVITILEQIIESYKVDQDEKIMTKTMVNNYVKSNLISKPIKKKYSRVQMMQLIMIYHLKGILTLEELEIFFKNSINDCDNSLENLYQDFLQIHEEELEEANLKVVQLYQKDKGQRIKEIMKIVIKADLNKKIAQNILKEMKELDENYSIDV
ncbi:DUF1836 domain-containing protein [Alkalibaculum sp. M08DMB]|uniref:DUF1836 domain-containing protein n=1 Tax=Alkalibaculum sporogenes TaxID=2655001 RepID=A0A6A7K7B9_9FIRM|nr:DUF1836 domain-containing protein [Alkalibaculum sporogenes]MPW25077.1 DUF1836 domain-containing protein [Alkalibaculum sporogenes]